MKSNTTITNQNEAELKDFLPEGVFLDNLFESSVDLTEEWNYVLGVTAADLAASGLPSPSPNITNIYVPVIWDYLNGIFAIGNGGKQLLFTSDDYRQASNKVKAVLNILSGVKLLSLSYNPALTGALHLSGASTLAGPAFALAAATDLTHVCIDYLHALKESTFEGWLDERLQEINFYNKRIKEVRRKVTMNKNEEYVNEIQNKIHEL